MKTINTIKALAAMLFVGAFASCSNDEMTKPATKYEISIAKSAEFKVEAGGRTLAQLGSTRALPGNPDVLFFKKADCPDLYRANFPDQKLTKEECEYVYACIKEDAAHIAKGEPTVYEVAKSSFTKKEFYIVSAYSSKDHDAKGDHSDVAGDMHDLGINGQYITDFNTNTCVAANLIITTEGLKDVTYDDSFGTKKQFVTVDDWKLFFIPDYGYYIGMDYHSAKEATTGDGDFSDWVVKIIPAVKHDEKIDETNGSVEINLSVNDEHSTGDFVATKLSIHVRALTDVEVFIPVDKKFYCEADDMDISLSHKQKDVIYNTEPQYVETKIDNTTVKFTVQYEDEGIRITTDGIDQSVIDFCAKEYADGITFEVWNYFKDITRTDLKPMLDKATVKFLDHNPVLYVNAFAKLNGYHSTAVYSKFNDAGQLVPYTDEACTQPLDQKYWTRETPDSKDYIFTGEPNPWDCVVSPVESGYVKYGKDDTDPNLPDYNVEYKLPSVK